MSNIVAMQAYIAKRCPKNIRGMIFAVVGIVASLGSILYLQFYSYMVQFGAWMAFGCVAILDAGYLIFLLAMIAIGKFGMPAAGTDDDEDQEQNDLRGPDAGKGGYEDIPKLDFKNEV